MRSSFVESVDVIEFQTTEAYSNLSLTKAVYNESRQSKEENLKVIERIRPKILMHSENRKFTWLRKYNLDSKKTPRSSREVVRAMAV
jgi:hypothetical protein